jgi:hypothetical protein
MNTRALVSIVLVFSASAISAEPIVSYDMYWEPFTDVNISSCSLGLSLWQDGSFSPEIISGVITPDVDIGKIFTATSSTPGFSDFVNNMNNGNGCVAINLITQSGQDISYGFLKSDVFAGHSNLQISTIHDVALEVKNFTLSTPDPRGLGGGYTCDFEFFVDAPEPSTMAVLIMALPILLIKRK